MSNLAIDYRNPSNIRQLGIEALAKELTPIGMAYFLRQYEMGTGDYTAEKEEEVKELTYEDYRRFKKNG